MFVKQHDATLDKIRAAVNAGDCGTLAIEFHSCKSSSATFGSELLPPIAQELETAAKANDMALINEKLDVFLAQFDDTCMAIEAAVAAIAD